MRIASALATLVAGCALALVIAYWGWQLFVPRPAHVAAPAPANPAATIVAANLFGGGGVATSSVTPGDAVLSGDTRLLGIIAEPRRGYALFRLPSGPRLVAQGEEIAPGATLVSVEPDAITVRDGAGERRFVLRAAAPAAAGGAQAPATTAPARSATPSAQVRASGAASCGPPAGFHGSVVRLNTELIGGLAGDAGPWRTLLAPAAGGLVVRDDGGFGAMLGLRAGDRLVQANGIALSVPEDVASAVIRPLVANQGVRLVGSRDGTTHELWLASVACAG
ncbi:MAG TPA: hypothetical protein VF059_05630 [Casimicrobiaceae bacterium]